MHIVTTDDTLIAQIRAGNTSAYATIVDRYRNRAMTLAVRLLHNTQDAEEALQDAFVRAFRSLNTFTGDAAFGTWFYRILYNVCLTRLAVRKRSMTTVPLSVVEAEPSADRAPDAELDRLDRAQQISEAIAELPQQYALVITLFYVQEMSHEEISMVAQMPIGTVKTHLHRARKLLAESLRTRGVVPEYS